MHKKFESLRRLSFPTIVTGVYVTSLVGFACVAWTFCYLDARTVAWADYMTVSRFLQLLLLLGISAFCVYWCARVWTSEIPPTQRLPADGWNKQLEKLAQAGINLQDTPTFLILGLKDEEAQRSLLDSAKQQIIVSPDGATSPAAVYATREAVFVFCSSAGLLGHTVSRWPTMLPTSANVSAQQQERHSLEGLVEQLQASSLGMETPTSPANASQAGAIQSGSVPRQTDQGVQLATLERPAASVSVEETSAGLAQQLDGRLETIEQLIAFDDRTEAGPWNPSSDQEALTSTEIANYERELINLCLRLKSERNGIAPVNGILATADISALGSSAAARNCGRALRKDLRQITACLGLRCPTLLAINGCEAIDGFRESIRRIGPETTAKLALGHVSNPHAIGSPQLSQEISASALSNLQQLSNTLLASPAVKLPKNYPLARLEISSRGRLRDSITTFTREALADIENESDQPSFVAGLFFVATGKAATQQGFSQKVLQQMFDLQQLLDWTPAEQHKHKRLLTICWLLRGISLFLAILIGVQIYWNQ